MQYKRWFPFKIGCTSYVIPDEIIPNVLFMADKVDDIELVLFESGTISNIPETSTIAILQQIANEHDITFSIHFPIDRKAGAVSYEERAALLQRILAVIELTQKLPVSRYVLHLEGLSDQFNRVECARWHSAVSDFCEELVNRSAILPESIAVENLSYHPRLHKDVVTNYKLSNCIDVGHLWLQDIDWEHYISETLPYTNIIHLHGVDSTGRDHVSLAAHQNKWQLEKLVSFLRGYSGVVTLEVFSESDTFQSLTLLKELWQKSLL